MFTEDKSCFWTDAHREEEGRGSKKAMMRLQKAIFSQNDQCQENKVKLVMKTNWMVSYFHKLQKRSSVGPFWHFNNHRLIFFFTQLFLGSTVLSTLNCLDKLSIFSCGLHLHGQYRILVFEKKWSCKNNIKTYKNHFKNIFAPSFRTVLFRNTLGANR